MSRSLDAVALALAPLGPVAAALALVYASGHGIRGAGWFFALAAFALAIAALVIVVRRHPAIGGLTLVAWLGVGALWWSYRAAPFPPVAPFAGALPSATPPPGLALYRIETGVIHRCAAFGFRGGGFTDLRDFAMTAVLVRHPRGDLLIDSGLGTSLDDQLARMPLPFRLISDVEPGASVAVQLAAAHYALTSLHGIVLTHAHWDHVSGVSELAGVPVLVSEPERRFVVDGGWIMDVARMVDPARWHTYAFEGGPYLGFPLSHDVYGDGSVVIVPAPGHTPGSVIVFVALADGQRYAFIGDLAWQREGVLEREERPWLVRMLGDDDPAAVRDALGKLAALAARFPELVIAPAHDARGFARIPLLPRDLR